jgi:hypothetical protein
MHFRVQADKSFPFLKKNGTIHWQKCALHYGASRAATAREWYRCGAPILQPSEMVQWLRDRDDARLKKIAAANLRHTDKEQEIVRLYTRERMGLRAIARYFNGRPSISGVLKILVRAGVYRSADTLDRQRLESEERKRVVVMREKMARHRVATCLWNLRKGIGVQRTCKEEGWNLNSIWNDLGGRASYRRFVLRRRRKWPMKRIATKHWSKIFPAESGLQSRIETILQSRQLEYVRECRLPGSRTRVDFKLADKTFIECKVGVNAAQMYQFIGQALHYQKFTTKIILCIPSDVEIRKDLHELIIEMGVLVCNESTVPQILDGKIISLPITQLGTPRTTHFVCKCCGSSERRRHRMNSYCVDCAPLIPNMKFDQRLNRWIPMVGAEVLTNGNKGTTDGLAKPLATPMH